MARQDITEALGRLDDLTRHLRTQCPWDREQDERSIVPHTVEEAYELADAAQRGDDGKLLDELGDVLFQVHFLALLMEERGAGDLAQVAEHLHAKLVRRHPHVFPAASSRTGPAAGSGTGPAAGSGTGPAASSPTGPTASSGTGGEAEVDSAGQVLANWDAIKRTEPDREGGIFGEVPENLPGPLYARKVQRRAASVGLEQGEAVPYETVTAELEHLRAAADREAAFHEVGDVLFAAVDIARKLRVDPELALRAAADRFRTTVTQSSEENAP